MMNELLLAAVILGFTAPASAADTVKPSRPRKQAATVHEGGWKSIELHAEEGLSFNRLVIEPGMRRKVFRADADAVVVAMNRQRFHFVLAPGKLMQMERGDFVQMRKGDVGGGFVAGDGGVELLFVQRSRRMPRDLQGDDVKKAAERTEARPIYSFREARAKADTLKGPLWRVGLVAGPGLKVDLIKLAGRATVNNSTDRTAILFAVEGDASARATESGAPVALRDDLMFIAAPGSTVHLEPVHDLPAYLLMISTSD